MSTNPIESVSRVENNSHPALESILSIALQSLTAHKTSGLSSIGELASIAQTPDSTELSPLSQLMSALEQVQQTDPAHYPQLTQQVATSLQSSAETAQTDGNTTAASELKQLADGLTHPSKTGQLPTLHDLAQAIDVHHHPHPPTATPT